MISRVTISLPRRVLAKLDEEVRELREAIARHGNPYPRGDLRHAPSFDEQVQDLQAVTIERVRAFHRRFVSAARGEFTAAGDIDVPAVVALESASSTVDQPLPLLGGVKLRILLEITMRASLEDFLWQFVAQFVLQHVDLFLELLFQVLHRLLSESPSYRL